MSETLAIDGGAPVRAEPFPHRRLIGEAERAAALRVFDEAIEAGEAFGYGGPFEQQYEQDFAASMGGGYADGVNSGTNALFCALGALELPPFSEVIVPPISDPGGVMPVIFVGCVPVPADAADGTYNTGAEQIAARLTDRTSAIVVAHIGGEPVDMDPVLALAAEHGLPVVEDCAQAHGARYHGRLVGTLGRIAAFSTMRGKHHCTGGQGGVVYTADEELHMRGRRFADRGKPFGLDAPGNVVAGLNCNLNELSAAIGSAQLARLPEIVRRRHEVGEAVKAGLAGRKAMAIGRQAPDTKCTYWFLRVRLDTSALTCDKARFCEALAAEGIPAAASYRHIPCEMPWFTQQKALPGGFPWTCSDYAGPRRPKWDLPAAVAATDQHFNIAVHENYTQREVDDILTALEKVERAYLR